MAKTDFENGTVVTDEFLDALQEHVHDGVDDDGHAPKVVLTAGAEVTGTLPLSNIVSMGSTDIADSSTLDSGTVTAALGILDARTTAEIEDISDLSGIMELTGFASNLNINYYAQLCRYRASSGDENDLNMVELWLPDVSGTGNSIYMSIDSSSIPSALRPTIDQSVPVTVYENSSTAPMIGVIHITTTGDWDIHLYNGNNFTNGAGKGIAGQMIRYRQTIT